MARWSSPCCNGPKRKQPSDQTQVIPCRAGVLSGVVYANGDVSFCETLPKLGNLRQKSFRELWFSPEADALRRSVHAKECWCTNEVFMWPSITYQPMQLAKALVASRPWAKAPRLDSEPGTPHAGSPPSHPQLKILP